MAFHIPCSTATLQQHVWHDLLSDPHHPLGNPEFMLASLGGEGIDRITQWAIWKTAWFCTLKILHQRVGHLPTSSGWSWKRVLHYTAQWWSSLIHPLGGRGKVTHRNINKSVRFRKNDRTSTAVAETDVLESVVRQKKLNGKFHDTNQIVSLIQYANITCNQVHSRVFSWEMWFFAVVFLVWTQNVFSISITPSY